MTNLWPMIRLDVRTMAAGSPMVLAAMALLVGAFALLGGSAFAMPIAAAITLSPAIGVFNADSQHGLTQLHGVLPVRRRTVVTSHFLVSFAVMGAMVALAAGLSAVGQLLRGQTAVGEVYAGMVLFAVLALLVVPQFPIQVKYGHSASRIVLLLFAAVVGLGLLAATLIGGESLRQLAGSIDDQVVSWLPATMLGIGLLAWVGSYLLTRWLYERQDH